MSIRCDDCRTRVPASATQYLCDCPEHHGAALLCNECGQEHKYVRGHDCFTIHVAKSREAFANAKRKTASV